MLVGLRTQAYFRKVAEDALASAGVFEPPVPVTKIIESLGIPILPVNLPLFFTAATINTDGLPVIVVNYAQPEPDPARSPRAHAQPHPPAAGRLEPTRSRATRETTARRSRLPTS